MKKTTVIILMIFVSLTVSACTYNSNFFNDSDYTDIVEIFDSLDNKIIVNKSDLSVVTLGSSITEIWTSIGGEVVGTTLDSIENKKLKIPKSAINVGIVKDPNFDEIIYANPNLVILSNNIPKHRELAVHLEKANINTYFTEINSFNDYAYVVENLTKLTGKEKLYIEKGVEISNNINAILSNIDDNFENKVLILRTSSSNLVAITSEHFTGDIFEDFGAINIAEKDSSILNTLSFDAILKEDPDYIFVIPMGKDYHKSMEIFLDFKNSNEEWYELSAVKKDRVINLPKDLFHSKPNHRWDESYEYIYDIFYKD